MNGHDMAAALRSMLPGVAIHEGPDGFSMTTGPAGVLNSSESGSNSNTTFSLIPAPPQRPGASRIEDLRSNNDRAEAFLDAKDDDEESRLIRCNILKGQGDRLLLSGFYREACAKYLGAIAAIVGHRSELPLSLADGGTASEKYAALSPWQRVDLMACCDGVAQCLIKLENVEEVKD